MEIRVLQYFLAVAQEENITKAAESLHMAQPSLSTQMKELELKLGKKLFIRGKRKITLTEEGMLLRQRAQEIIQLVEKTEKEISLGNDIINGEIAIGSGETIAMSFVLDIIKKLSDEQPNIKYHLFSGDAQDIGDRLDNGLLDFGLLIEPIDLDKYNRIQLPIHELWGLLVRKDAPLASKKYIEPKDMKTLKIIIPKRKGLQIEFTNWLSDNANIIGTYNLVHHAALMVEKGICYAFAINDIINTRESSDLAFIPLHPNHDIKIAIVWKKYQYLSKSSRLFLDYLNHLIQTSDKK